MGWSRKYKACIKRNIKGKGKIGTRMRRAAKKCQRYRKKKK